MCTRPGAQDDERRCGNSAAGVWIVAATDSTMVVVERASFPASLVLPLPNRQRAGAGVVVGMLQHHRHKVHAPWMSQGLRPRDRPLLPAGFWASSCGPVMKPSSDIAIVKNTLDTASLRSSHRFVGPLTQLSDR
jgi:hypothetical protein